MDKHKAQNKNINQTPDEDLKDIMANLQTALLKNNPKRSIKEEFIYKKLIFLGLIWRLKYRMKYNKTILQFLKYGK